ncbi:hypothetical protein [Dyadobacter frigoris]|uniref:Uncharacterized protein n=1 Tax=Dyadobacter frigoris TaxID=2576211 RepID=A0A4V6BJ67_9BACT|nr:hypothetical protein [Dyadobacter frigoris]TKT91973.1 hypothetical protein FDK13_12575 [Dyadobacter frigoris]GLU53153.1 hypothetical protein Dfri01_26140 [Dyadobacter frigoris]
MKQSLCLLYILFFLSVTLSCTNEKPELKKTALTKEEVLNLIQSQILYVTKIERKAGNETVDLTNLPEFDLYRKSVFFTFRQGYILILSGSEIPNTKYPASAKTFSFSIKIPLPLNLEYYWDDAAGTVVTKSNVGSSTIPIPFENPAKLDLASIISYTTLEAAQVASTPPSLKFTVDLTDPKLGPVTYSYTLKPVWSYEKAGDVPNYYNFVVF